MCKFNRELKNKIKKQKMYRVNSLEVLKAEKEYGYKFPKELRAMYLFYGCGHINNGNLSRFNRILEPMDIADFYLGRDLYDNDERLEYYKEEIDDLVLMEVSEVSFITIRLNKKDNNNILGIFYDDIKLSDSLDIFLNLILEDGEFYLNM